MLFSSNYVAFQSKKQQAYARYRSEFGILNLSPLQVPSLKVLLVGAGFAITEDETVTLGADFKEVHFGFLPLTLFFRVCQFLDSLKDSKQFARRNSFFNLPQVFSELYATVSRIVELSFFRDSRL